MRFVGTIVQQGHQIRSFHCLLLQYSSLLLLSVGTLITKRYESTFASSKIETVTALAELTPATSDFTSPKNTTSRKRRKRQLTSLITDTPAMLNNTRSDNSSSSSSSYNNSKSNSRTKNNSSSAASSSSSSWYNIDDAGIAKYLAHREVHRNETLSILVDGFRFTRPLKRYILRSRVGEICINDDENDQGRNQAKANSVTRRGSAQYSMKEIDNVKVFYLLSHFHADHYTGLNGSWKSGIIHCSRGTAELTAYKLHVDPSYLFPMEFGVTYLFSLASGQCITKWSTQQKQQKQGSLEKLSNVQTLSNECTSNSTNKSINNDNNNYNNLLDEEGMCADGTFTVHLVPANHCPGAALFIFTSPAFGRIIHTGDLRFNSSLASWTLHAEKYGGWLPTKKDESTTNLDVDCKDLPVTSKENNNTSTHNININTLIAPPFYEQFMQDDPALQAVASRVDKLFLDNTFCDPNYRFPRQWHVNQEVISTLYSLLTRPSTTTQPSKQRSKNVTFAAKCSRSKSNSYCKRNVKVPNEKSIHCAVLVGSYTIGKERVALAIQDAFRSINKTSSFDRYCNVNEKVSTHDLIPIYTHPEKYELLRRLSYHTNHFTPVEVYHDKPAHVAPSQETVNGSNAKNSKRHTLREALEKSKSLQSTSMEASTTTTTSFEVKQTSEAIVKEEQEKTMLESSAGVTDELLQEKSAPSFPKETSGMHSVHVYKHEVCLPHWSLRQSSLAQCSAGQEQQSRSNNKNTCNVKENARNYRRSKTSDTNVRSSQNIKETNDKDEEEEELEEEDTMHYYLSIYLVPLHVLSLSNLRSATGWQYKRGRYDTESKTWISHKEENSDSSSSDDDNNKVKNSIERKHNIGNFASSSSPTLLTMGAHYGIDLSLFDRVLAVEPSGWVRATRSENITDWCTLLHVPYSEHCSFDEMLSFTEFVNPLKVVPTVSEVNFRKREALFVERAPRMKNGKKTTIPITRFFNKVVSSTLSVFTSHKKVHEKEEEEKEEKHEEEQKVIRLQNVKAEAMESDVNRRAASVELIGCDDISSNHTENAAKNAKAEENVIDHNNSVKCSANNNTDKNSNEQGKEEVNEIYDVSSGVDDSDDSDDSDGNAEKTEQMQQEDTECKKVDEGLKKENDVDVDDDDKVCKENNNEKEYYFVEV